MFLIFEMILFFHSFFFASNALGISHIIANDLIGYMIDDSSQLEDLKKYLVCTLAWLLTRVKKMT